jgi:hypothetical protein
VLSNLAVTRSSSARTFFLVSAAITVAVMLWANSLGGSRARDLSYIFLRLFTQYDYTGAICGLLILLIAALLLDRIPARSILRWFGEHPVGIALACVVVLSAGSLLVYENHPLSMDEYAAYFQSQVFAGGRLAGRFPVALVDWLVPPYFQGRFLSISPTTGAVASPYWPSFALILAPFTKLGIPWICNPLISAATLLAIHRLTFDVFEDVEASGAAILFTLASPVFFANGISYYSMPAHLLANTLYALLLLHPTPRRALVAGIVGSIALTLHNPVPHMLFAAPWVLWIAGRENNAKLTGCLLAGYIPLCLLLGVGWFKFSSGLTQDATDIATAAGNAKIWVWSVPGLMLLAGVGAWRWRRNKACRTLLISALVTLVGFCLVPFDQGHGWGYRYFHSAWMALPILAAGALMPRVPGTRSLSVSGDELATLVVGCALLALFLSVGFRAAQMHEFIASDLSHVPGHQGTGPRVLMLNPVGAWYEADLIQNDPWLRGDVIRMMSYGRDENAAIMQLQFPQMHRVYWDRFGETWTASPQSSR